MDKAYILGLRRYSDALDATTKHLSENGVGLETFWGLDYQITGLRTSIPYDVDVPGTDYKMGPKSVSMTLSHYMMWKHAYHAGAKSLMVMEDDVRLLEGWRPVWEESLRNLPTDWDLFFPGSCCLGHSIQSVTPRLHKVSQALCTHWYCVNGKFLETLLVRCEKIWAPIDVAIHFAARDSNANVYAIVPRIAEQLNTVLEP
jgi:GR25 family glycosyltransferase involved in LPS biosynthesis